MLKNVMKEDVKYKKEAFCRLSGKLLMNGSGGFYK